MIDDPSELLGQFNTHFSKIADELREKLPDLNIDLSRLTFFVNSRKDHDVVFTLRDITVNQVLSILKRVSPNKSAGIDGINVRLLRLAAPVITLSIARIIDYPFSLSGVLLVDYCKAFDMVDHNLLLLKLEAYGAALPTEHIIG